MSYPKIKLLTNCQDYKQITKIIKITNFDPISIMLLSFSHLFILVIRVNEKFDLFPSIPEPRNVGIVLWFTTKRGVKT